MYTIVFFKYLTSVLTRNVVIDLTYDYHHSARLQWATPEVMYTHTKLSLMYTHTKLSLMYTHTKLSLDYKYNINIKMIATKRFAIYVLGSHSLQHFAHILHFRVPYAF